MNNFIIKQVDYIRSKNSIETQRNIVKTKIENCRYFLTRYRNARKNSDQSSYISANQNYLHSIAQSLPYNKSIMLTEAQAALRYWQSIKIICKQDPAWKRIYPGAKDPLNVALNIGYTFLGRFCEEALKKVGLHTSLALLHATSHEKGLVFDFMEPFRQVVVDSVVVPMFSRGKNELRAAKLVAKIREKLTEIYNYKGERISLGNVIRYEAYELRNSIENNIPWQPFRIQWGNSRK